MEFQDDKASRIARLQAKSTSENWVEDAIFDKYGPLGSMAREEAERKLSWYYDEGYVEPIGLPAIALPDKAKMRTDNAKMPKKATIKKPQK